MRRETVFRTLAAILAALMAGVMVMDLAGSAELAGGGIVRPLSIVALIAVFATYAILGARRANTLLARLIWLSELPARIFERTVGRFIELPELEESDRGDPGHRQEPPEDDS